MIALAPMLAMIDIFPEPTEMGIGPLFFMMAIYGYILCTSASLIGDGSEMLLVMHGPGIVGGVLIPLLGALPDAAVIIISGMGSGSKEEIQEELAVGVGTLVGSTVMLLTIPWSLSIFYGRRDYDEKKNAAASAPGGKGKCTKTSLFQSCVTVMPDIPSTAIIMMAASASYLIIQIPAFFYVHEHRDAVVAKEAPFAIVGVIATAIGFAAYCYMQVRGANNTEIERRRQEAARRKQWAASLSRDLSEDHYQEAIFRNHDKDNSGFIEEAELASALTALGLKVGRRDLRHILESIDVGDEEGAGKGDGKISLVEFKQAVTHWVNSGENSDELTSSSKKRSARNTPDQRSGGQHKKNKSTHSRRNSRDHLMHNSENNDDPVDLEMGESKSSYGAMEENGDAKSKNNNSKKNGAAASDKKKKGNTANAKKDTDKSDKDKESSKKKDDKKDDKKDAAAEAKPIKGKGKLTAEDAESIKIETKATGRVPDTRMDDEAEDEEQEADEEEFYHLSASQLQWKAIGILAIGALIVTLVSDPMVDVIGQVGKRLNVSAFYVSFIVTPFASNASEVIASLMFAKKKTSESISLTLATLHGAATMNSTLCLCIFMSLVYFRELTWSFSAEVITVILVILAVGLNGLKTNIFLWQAALVATFYPLAILNVYILENIFGLD